MAVVSANEQSLPQGAPSASGVPGLLPALAVLVGVQFAYIIWVGGDYFPGWRFFVPILAPLVILAGEAARRGLAALPALPAARRGAAGALGLALALYAASFAEPQRVITELTVLHSTYVDRWGSAGLWLREHTRPASLTAVKGAGAIAYYGRRPILDAYGLNDRYIGRLPVANMGAGNPGHEKADPVYVLDRQPDYILELDNYLEPVKARFTGEYRSVSERSPTGVMIRWWQRTAAPAP